MISVRSRSFNKRFDQLPLEMQDRARDAFRRFEEDPTHPSLRFRRVHPSLPIYSARVSLEYRALARRRDDVWVWVWIGSHAEYDEVLRRR